MPGWPELIYEEKDNDMLSKTYCAAVVGLEATTITVEVNMTRGVMFNLSGMA